MYLYTIYIIYVIYIYYVFNIYRLNFKTLVFYLCDNTRNASNFDLGQCLLHAAFQV